MSVETLNYLLALGTLAMQLLGAGFFALYFLQNKFTDLQDIAALLSRWGLWLAFLLTLGATAMTLYYSEVLGFAPCGWCWVQRVFLWPQVYSSCSRSGRMSGRLQITQSACQSSALSRRSISIICKWGDRRLSRVLRAEQAIARSASSLSSATSPSRSCPQPSSRSSSCLCFSSAALARPHKRRSARI